MVVLQPSGKQVNLKMHFAPSSNSLTLFKPESSYSPFEISTPPFELFRNLNSIWQQIIPIRCNKYCFIQLIRRIICQGCALL